MTSLRSELRNHHAGKSPCLVLMFADGPDVLISCRGKCGGELFAGHLGLLAGGEVLHCQDTGLELVAAEDDDFSGELVGGLERFFESKAGVAQLDAEAGAAEFAGQLEGLWGEGFAERR